jgi:hypothetical protein
MNATDDVVTVIAIKTMRAPARFVVAYYQDGSMP